MSFSDFICKCEFNESQNKCLFCDVAHRRGYIEILIFIEVHRARGGHKRAQRREVKRTQDDFDVSKRS